MMTEARKFVTGRDSATVTGTHNKDARMAMEYRKTTDVYPLFPRPGWQKFFLPAINNRPWYGAYRDPETLMDAWAEACFLAGRLDSPVPQEGRVLVRADGIADKPHTYHCGLVLCDDEKRMSGYSQRDFVLGCYSEKNQFHMLCMASQIRTLGDALRARGSDLWLNADMVALKNLSRGLFYADGGFGYKDFNAGVCPCGIFNEQAGGQGAAGVSPLSMATVASAGSVFRISHRMVYVARRVPQG